MKFRTNIPLLRYGFMVAFYNALATLTHVKNFM